MDNLPGFINVETLTLEGVLTDRVGPKGKHIFIKNEDATELSIEWIWDGIKSPYLFERYINKIVRVKGRVFSGFLLADEIEEIK